MVSFSCIAYIPKPEWPNLLDPLYGFDSCCYCGICIPRQWYTGPFICTPAVLWARRQFLQALHGVGLFPCVFIVGNHEHSRHSRGGITRTFHLLQASDKHYY